MNSGIPPISTIGGKITSELKEFIIIAAYLCVCFTVLAYFKAAILQAHGIEFAPFGFAVVKALLCAKFISVGHALHIGQRSKSKSLFLQTLHRSVAFLSFVILLTIIEEVIVGLFHHQTILVSIAEVGGGTLDQLLAESVVILLILIPFFAFQTLGEALGEDNLIRLFFGRRNNS
jgi:hypothetical protein